MTSSEITKKLNFWKSFFNFSEKDFNFFKKEIIEVYLKPGDHLYDFNELPKGIILINQGILRLVGKNANNELFSIDKFKEKEIASAITILLEKKNTSLIASNNVNGFFFKKRNIHKTHIKE